MNKKNLKLIAVLVSASLVMGTSRANIGSALDAMWYSSAGGATSGTQSMGIYGPSVSLRSPNKTYNVAYFDPPRISAGCSGMDMTFGSFGMLKIDAFKDLVRKIMQNAPGYLMQLAIKSMCDDCSSILQSLQNLANVVNSNQINSCRVSQSFYSALDKDRQMKDFSGTNTKALLESYTSTVTGRIEGTWDALNKLFTDSKVHRKEAEGGSTEYGNTFVNTFYTNKGDQRMSYDVFGGEKEAIQIMQSLIGTKIYKTSDQKDSSGTNASDDTWHSDTLTFDDLVKGYDPAVKKTYLFCNDFTSGDPSTCQQIHPKEFNYIGIKRYMMEKYAGAQTDVNGDPSAILSQIQDNSIIDKFQRGLTLTPTEKSLLASTPIGLQRMLISLASTDGYTRLSLLDQAFDVMAYVIASSVGLSVASTIKTVYQPNATATGTKRTVGMTDLQLEKLSKLERDARAYSNAQDRNEKLQRLAKHIAEAKAYNASIALH
jgi:conjugative transfer pilus assembly protein TraH